jgi:hypothetical protein
MGVAGRQPARESLFDEKSVYYVLPRLTGIARNFFMSLVWR